MHNIPVVFLPSTRKWIITSLMKFVEILVFCSFNPSSYLHGLKMLSKPNLIDVQLVIYENQFGSYCRSILSNIKYIGQNVC